MEREDFEGCKLERGFSLLADEKHIYSAQVKVVKKREGGEAVIGRVLASVELWPRCRLVSTDA